VQVFLSHGANILYVDYNRLNTLHYAAASENIKIISRILKTLDTNCLNIFKSKDKSDRNTLYYILTYSFNIKEV
jgi:hypothetical protein